MLVIALFSVGGVVAEYVPSVLVREPVRLSESSVGARVAASTGAVYAWDARAARVPFLLKQ